MLNQSILGRCECRLVVSLLFSAAIFCDKRRILRLAGFVLLLGIACGGVSKAFAAESNAVHEEEATPADQSADEAESTQEVVEEPAATESTVTSEAAEIPKPVEKPAAPAVPVAAAESGISGVPAGMDLPPSLLKAEAFELRGENLSAQMEYTQALRESLLHVQNSEETTFNLAQGEFLVEKLLDLSARTGEKADLLKELQTLQENMKLPPLMVARMDWAQLQLHMRAGDAAKAREIGDRLHFLRNWTLSEGVNQPTVVKVAPISPVVPAGGKGEKAEATKPVSEGKSPEQGGAYQIPIAARFMTVTSPEGLVPLDSYLPPLRLRNVRVTTVVEVEKACDAALRLGAGAPVQGYINDHRFLSTDEARRPGFDVGAWGLHLRKGRNLLTLEFRKVDGFPASFYARLTAPDGSALGGVSYPAVAATALAPSEAANNLSASGAGVAPDEGATQKLSTIFKDNPSNHRAAYYLGWLLCRRQTLGANAPAARQLLMQAARLSPQCGIYLLAIAGADENSGRQLPDRDNNLSRMALLKALEIDPKNVAALTMLAGYYLDNMNIISEAQTLVDRALEANPGSPEAAILLCRIYNERGWGVRALQLAVTQVKRNPTMPALRLLATDLAMSFSTAAEARKDISPALTADHTNVEIFTRSLLVLKRLGESQQAKKLLKQHLQLYPADNAALRDLADLSLRAGEVDSAQEALDTALTLNPYDGEALRLKAAILQRQGKEALAIYEQAYVADPSNPTLRDYLTFRGVRRPSPLTVIADLAEYVQQSADYHPVPGEDGVFLLYEQGDELRTNGTKRRTLHRVVRITDQRSAENNRRIPVWYDGDTEEAQVTVARVLHANGQLSTGQTIPVPREGDRQVTLVVFPSLQSGDVLELEYAVNQVRPDFFGDYFGNIQPLRYFSPVRESRYVLLTPESKTIYLHKTGGAPDPKITTADGQVIRVWQMRELPAIEPLPLMPPLREITPTVQISTFKDWDTLGRWYWNLVKDQNLSTSAIKEKLVNLSVGVSDPQVKLAAIFGFVCNDIRNNAWEFGVHGYKPYNAGTIFTRRFGDCKDKATLINVMAREAGLEAWPVLLRATDPSELAVGRVAEDLSLPILAHFNHCISMVIAGGERYYLDGTIPYHTIDSLPFTDTGAEAIIVRPEGAERVALPPHTPQRNAWQQELTVKISADGVADFEDSFQASGQGAAYLRSWFRNPDSWDNVMRAVCSQRYGRVAAVVVEDVGEATDAPNTMEFQGRVRIADFAKPTANGLSLRVPEPLLAGEFGRDGAVPREFSSFARTSARSLDVVLPTLFSIKRKIRLEWPDGWELSEKLENQLLKTDFGTLKVTYSLNGNLLEIDYEVELTRQWIAVTEYKTFRRFCTAADVLGKSTLSLVELGH